MKINKSLFDTLCNRAGFGDLKPDDRTGSNLLYSVKLFGVYERNGNNISGDC